MKASQLYILDIFTKTSESENSVNQNLFIYFDYPELYTQTNPLTCTILGQNIILDKQSWLCLLISGVEYFIDKINPNSAKQSITFRYGIKIAITSQKLSSGKSVFLSNGI